jgi:hypothetical protein
MSPGRVKFDDLPVKVRRRLETGGDVGSATPAAGPTPAAPADPAPNREGWRCHQCAQQFHAWTRAEGHALEARHPRIELLPR